MSSLLKSWIAIEFLSVSNEIDINDKNTIIFTPANYERINGSEYKSCRIKVATFRTFDIYNIISEIFNDDSFQEQSSSAISYVCEFDVDFSGNLNSDSIAISSFPWAVNQLQKGIKPNHWEQTFQIFKDNLIEVIIDIFKVENKTLFEKINGIESFVKSSLNWQPHILQKAYFAPQKRIQGEQPLDIILNSFYTKDLTLINKKKIHEWNKALQDYVLQQDKCKKTDLLKKSDIVKNKLSAKYIPDGSWASPYSLSLMQQYAVNHIINDLADTFGYFSVNGPPGTGKTTLLKDAIAAIIVKRAKVLSNYDNPSNAFTLKGSYAKTGTYSVRYYKPDIQISDDAIIVASSNNAAVENISKELPKIDSEYGENNYPDNGYFKEIAQLLFGDSSWNCCSFALGNSSNRSNFINIWEKWNDETKSYDKPFQEAIDS